jgi:hypothetical protein
MDDNAGKSAGDGENPDNKAASSDESATAATPPESASEAKLPVVWSPKLDAGEANVDGLFGAGAEEAKPSADAAHDQQSEPGRRAAHGAAPSRSLRFAMLAASLAAAAAIGSLAGSLSATGVAHLWPARTPPVAVAYSGPQATKAELAELAALKANLDSASRNASGQFARLAERLDRVERAQAEPAAKLARLAEAIDRLEKKGMTASSSAAAAAPETTGTIPASPSATTAEAKPPENVLREWIVHDVRGGRALVGNRFGAIFDVGSGSILPGLGKVEAIKRQDNVWIVVTAHGVIYSVP